MDDLVFADGVKVEMEIDRSDGRTASLPHGDLKRIRGCEEQIGYRFSDPTLLLQASA